MTPVSSTREIDDLFEQSSAQPVLLFKHDPYCPISHHAHEEVLRAGYETHVVDVAHDKPVASAVTERTRVQHESPQVLVLRNGTASWTASHYEVTAEGIDRAMRQAA